jgi:transcriptional regulator with XRE-family HTH domain
MLDTKKVGFKLASLRKRAGYSQERLGELLRVSPQAISKWENGHTLPDTSLLPMLAQIYGCTIDDFIMPAYSFEENLEEERPNQLEEQAALIAESVITKLEGKLLYNEQLGLDDSTIVEALYKAHGHIGGCTVFREKPYREYGNFITSITVRSSQKDYKLIQKAYVNNDAELHHYGLLGRHTTKTPQVLHIDQAKKIILIEDLSDGRIRGYDFNEDNENGIIIRENNPAILSAAANLHTAFWENKAVLDQLGLEWRLQSEETMLTHILALEQDYKKYRKNEEAGKLPKVWECFVNNLDTGKLGLYDEAVKFLRREYVKLVAARFVPGVNVTVIHGNLHPGMIFMSKAGDRDVRFDGLQAVRVGLPTEDLAMLLALHIEPDGLKVRPLLDHYYSCLSESVTNYPYDTFLNDYRISVAENLFFPIRLINGKTFDYSMRDKALRAFETFVLDV